MGQREKEGGLQIIEARHKSQPNADSPPLKMFESDTDNTIYRIQKKAKNSGEHQLQT
jgi:hypothetical protein